MLKAEKAKISSVDKSIKDRRVYKERSNESSSPALIQAISATRQELVAQS
jgi:hypothetical protein